MPDINIKQAYYLLSNCTAVEINEHALAYPSVYREPGDSIPPGDFLLLNWRDDDGGFCEYIFRHEDNQVIHLDCMGRLFMFRDDEEKTEVMITLLRPDVDAEDCLHLADEEEDPL